MNCATRRRAVLPAVDDATAADVARPAGALVRVPFSITSFVMSPTRADDRPLS